MRVLLLNWAFVWDGAAKGGGVNGYCQSLALELVALGHDVSYLSSGVSYTPDGACALRRHHDWLGVRVFEIVNSPVMAPGGFQFGDPAAEISAPELEAVVASLVDRIRPDVVHAHNIEGFSVGCVKHLREHPSRPAVVFSLHNYHTVCPQVYLMHRYVTPCHDAEGGARCTSCIDAPDRRAELVRRSGARAGGDAMPPAPPNEPAGIVGWARALFGSPRRDAAPESPPGIGVPLSVGGEPHSQATADLMSASPAPEPDTRGQTAQVIFDRRPPTMAGPGHPTWEPITNDIPALPAVAPSNDYGRRREAMVDMLNGCDRVLAVSEFVRRRFVSFGVREDRVTVQHIGTRANRAREVREELAFDPPAFDGASPRPIRLVYMGHAHAMKGLPMLADSLELLTAEYLARFHLYLFIQDGQSIEWRFRRMEPRLAGLGVYHGYQFWDIPWMLGGKDVGVVPSIWWDNAPQTVFEFFSCGVPVIGADVGGIPDFVRHGRNGLLFRANDRYDLARTLVEIARDPGRLEALRRGVRPPIDIVDHARAVVEVYESCAGGR